MPDPIVEAPPPFVTRGALAIAEAPAPTPAPLRHEPVTELVVPTPAPSTVQEKAEPDLLTTWRALVDRVRKEHPPVAAMLDLAVPKTMTKAQVVIGVEDDSFEETRGDQLDAKAILERAAREHFGAPTKVVIEEAARGTKQVASVAFLDQAKRKQMQIEARQAVEGHVLVQHALKVFSAELKDVKLPPQED
jgi:hypothetical protein